MTHIAPDIQTRVVLLAIIGEQQEQAVEMQKQITKLEEENKGNYSAPLMILQG